MEYTYYLKYQDYLNQIQKCNYSVEKLTHIFNAIKTEIVCDEMVIDVDKLDVIIGSYDIHKLCKDVPKYITEEGLLVEYIKTNPF